MLEHEHKPTFVKNPGILILKPGSRPGKVDSVNADAIEKVYACAAVI
jgi:hypothetical protein